MVLSVKQLWLGVGLCIVSLIVSYTVVLLATEGTDVFAASLCINGEECGKGNCPHRNET